MKYQRVSRTIRIEMIARKQMMATLMMI